MLCANIRLSRSSLVIPFSPHSSFMDVSSRRAVNIFNEVVSTYLISILIGIIFCSFVWISTATAPSSQISPSILQQISYTPFRIASNTTAICVESNTFFLINECQTQGFLKFIYYQLYELIFGCGILLRIHRARMHVFKAG